MSMTAAGADKRLDIGKVLQDGIDVLGRNIVPFGLMALLLQALPALVAGVGQSMSARNPAFAILSIVGGLTGLVTNMILQGALIYGTMRALDGDPASISDCLKVGRKRWLMLLGLFILVGLGMAVGLILLVVPGVLLALRWCVAAQTVVMEPGRGIQDAMARSVALTKGRRGAIFLLFLIYIVLVAIFEGVTVTAAGGLMAISTKPIVLLVVSPVLGFCSTLLVTTLATSLYRQLRGDKEGASAAALSEVFA